MRRCDGGPRAASCRSTRGRPCGPPELWHRAPRDRHVPAASVRLFRWRLRASHLGEGGKILGRWGSDRVCLRSGRRRSRRPSRPGAGRGACGRPARSGPEEPEAANRRRNRAEQTEEPRVLGQPRLLGRREFVPYDGPRYAPYDPELE